MNEHLKRYPLVQHDNFWPKASLAGAFLSGMLVAFGIVSLVIAVLS